MNKPVLPETQRKPSWLRVKAFRGETFDHVAQTLQQHGLNTVCQAANCPNRGQCFNRGTATFLLMGPVCTRNCRFCNIEPGVPSALDSEEPLRVARAAAALNLRHVVLTSVTRDDLPDGGAAHFAAAIKALRDAIPAVTVEVLTPDFKGKAQAPDIIAQAHPDVFNHNIETVPRLYDRVRPQADYRVSLNLLARMSSWGLTVKSGLMVGLGESVEELGGVFSDMRSSGVSRLTIGQYLAPSKRHLPVARYLSPEEFDHLKGMAETAGIKQVMSAPLVRSSYMADSLL